MTDVRPARCVTALALRTLADAAGGIAARFGAFRDGAYPWWLDSALADGRLGRFSFAGCDPYLVLRARGRACVLERRRDVRPDLADVPLAQDADPLDLLRALLPPPPAAGGGDDAPPFVGGAIALFGHELAAQLERVAFHGEDALGLPDLVVSFVDGVLAFDHARGRLVAAGLGFAMDEATARARARAAADAIARRAERGAPPAGVRPGEAAAATVRAGGTADGERAARCAVEGLSSAHAAEHAKRVERAKERIEAGDAYQVCLTHRLDAPCPGDPFALYTALRRLNPAPFAAYVELPEVAIVGSSPERFLRLDGTGRAETRPMKGTRPRGDSSAEDARLRAELAVSEKDRAENVMIVDLARNDLGRVCETGSVAVPELCGLETYPSVHQLVSTVTGRLRPDRDAIDLFRAAFPPGSMTGAPKIAALRILDGLEPVRRGVYAGALGYLDARGGVDLCVVIRTLLVRDGRAYFHVGGGIVADSEPGAEWRESLDKARSLVDALASASRARPDS